MFLAAFGQWSCRSGEKSAEKPVLPPARNVVVVLLDALRPDHLSCYGYVRPTSPNMDSLAAEGATFLEAISPAPWTLPAMATMWTSLYPSVHGANQNSDMNRWRRDPKGYRVTSALEKSRVTLAELLRENGFATAGFVDGGYPSRAFGFAQGFDSFVDQEIKGLRLNVEAMMDWLDRERPDRFFVYLHSVDVHSPYSAPLLPARFRKGGGERGRYVREAFREEQKRYASFDFDPQYRGEVRGDRKSLEKLARAREPLAARDLEHLRALYDSGVAYADYWIGQIVQRLRDRALFDDTLVIVTADHGDEFLEHGGFEHSLTYYDEMLRVPLIVHAPGRPRGLRIERQVGLIDIAPTVLDLVGLGAEEAAVAMQGVSLVPLLDGGDMPPRVLYAEASMNRRLILAARSEEEKFILVRGEKKPDELYDLESDPGEKDNLCVRQAERCREWRRRAIAWRDEMVRHRERLELPEPSPAEVDDATRDRLRALGYQE